MRRDPLHAVLKLRRMVLEDAKRGLADQLRAEDAARLLATAAEAEITREMERATSLATDDGDVEAFAAWLPVGRGRAAAAQARAETAAADTARARAELSAARASVEAAESMLAKRAEAQAVAEARASQAALDEAAAQARRYRPEH